VNDRGALSLGQGTAARRRGRNTNDSTTTVTASSVKSSLPVLLEVIASGTTQLNAKLLDPTHIRVKYETLMGNQPGNFGNVISVWSGGQIGWRNNPQPVVSVPICGNTPDGDTVITLPREATSGGPPYLVAYGTSDSGTAYCASQVAGPGDPQPFTTQLGVPWAGTNSLLASFTTPQGNLPKSYGNWMGLWRGEAIRYDSINRIAKVNIDVDDAQSSQAMNGLALTFSTLYTIGYACGPRDEDLAAWITFKTEPYLRYLFRALFQGQLRDSA